jgi:tRNA(fMet)-specific endonuclease VapC
MLHMLDTNICSYILKHHPPEVRDRFHEVGNDALALSAVVLAELYFGAARHRLREDIRREIDDFTARISIVPWDGRAADHYGNIRADLEKSGSRIGAMDMMIAAHARSFGATLVTNDTKHFAKVPDLSITNWLR